MRSSPKSLFEVFLLSVQTINQRPRRRFTVYGRRMLAAMLCWTALQSAVSQFEDGRARAQANTPVAR